MIEPTERSMWLLAGIGVCAVVGIGLPALGTLSAFALGLWVLVVFVDAVLAPSPKRMVVGRDNAARLVQGEISQSRLQVQVAKAGDYEVTDTLPLAASVESRRVEHTFDSAGDEMLTLQNEVVFDRRGQHRFGDVVVRSIGPMRLVKRRARHSASDEVRVVPNLTQVYLDAERLLRGEGGGRKRKHFSRGREFDSLRDYARGDDPRMIEWKASARTRTLVVRKMMPEVRQDVFVVLDHGRHFMGKHDVVDGGERRSDVALKAALRFCAAALSNGDRVGTMAFASEVSGVVMPKSGRPQLRLLARTLSDAEALPEESGYGEVARALLKRQKKRALVAFFTDVTDVHSARELIAAVGFLRGRHLPVVFAFGDPALERLRDGVSSSGEGEKSRGTKQAKPDALERMIPRAAERLYEQRQKALAGLAAAGAHVVPVGPQGAAREVIGEYRAIKNTGRL